MTYTNANDIATEAAAYLVEEWALVKAASEAEDNGLATPDSIIERYAFVMSNIVRLVNIAKNLGVYDEVKRLAAEKSELAA